jgi:maltooligosyltrehalose trehalohydrolase
MLFMGQEFSASNPFWYFADHEPDLAEKVRKGRREFMTQFPRLVSFVGDADMPDPADESTFLDSKLDWDECETHAEWLRLHRDLIRLRRDDDIFSRQDVSALEGAVIASEAFVLRWFDDSGNDRLALFNLGREIDWLPVSEPLIAPPCDKHWQLLWSSEDPAYGGWGTPTYDEKRWRVPGHSAVVFRAAEDED